MSANPFRLEALLESVADGSSVDWDAAEAAASERDRPIVRNLRLVAGISEVHRSIADEAPALEASLLSTVTSGQAIPRWGHLLLLETIGEGAFGEVYRARDPWLDRQVALKLLKPGIVDPTRLVGEARALARVRNPGVVTVHGADVHEGRVGLWMELVRGRTLASIVSSEGPFSAAEAAVIGQELCKAVSAVHAAGLVHRDIKAQNVMREAGGRLVLMDFGAGHTPLYAAPELADGAAATVATDIYAMGVLLYYLVTGRFPVAASSIADLKRAHVEGRRTRLAEARPDLPETFVPVVERALDPDPARRFASAREMQEALGASRGRALPFQPLWAAAAVLALVLGWAGYQGWRGRQAATPPGAIQLMAVLPFEDLSADAPGAALASAVPMELTARLGQIGALRVVPWTFTSRFRGDAASLTEVVKATKADAVVEGAVQRLVLPDTASPIVRVRVQVYRASTGSLLWTHAYERPLSDFLTLQSELAQDIARQVNVVVARREQMRFAQQARKTQPDALEDYLRGRDALLARQDVPAAVRLFESAVQRDPELPEAHASLALAYALESAYVGSVPASVAHPRAVRQANRAIELDESMAEAYAARAFAQMALAWNWTSASGDLTRALALGPNSADVHDEHSTYLTYHARHDEAIAAARRAEERAPLAAGYGRKVAWALYMARRYDDAVAQLQRVLLTEPGYVPALTLLGRAYLLLGRFDEGIRTLRAAGKAHEPKLALALAMAGRRAEATELLQQMTAGTLGVPVDPYEVSVVQAALGDSRAALLSLQRAFRERDPALAFLLVDPMFDPIRSAPQFQDIVKKMNFAQ